MDQSTVVQALSWADFADKYLGSLGEGRRWLAAGEPREVEEQWLLYAEIRLKAAREVLDEALSAAILLPELEVLRKREVRSLRAAWVDSIEALRDGITEHTGPNGPLLEVLFAHGKLEKLRKGGPFAEAFHTEYARRSRSAYVQRLAGEPEHPYLLPLLDRVDAARLRLEELEVPRPMEESRAAGLRSVIAGAADGVWLRLTQARCLAEAAFAEVPERLSELGLEAKPRRRALKSGVPPPRSVAPVEGEAVSS